MLKQVNLKHVGPASQFRIEFGERINLITGDNGLGKSFLLDVAWRALTGTGVGNIPWPQQGKANQAEISYTIGINNQGKTLSNTLNWHRYKWTSQNRSKPINGLVIYISSDDKFSVWDSARNYREESTNEGIHWEESYRPAAYHFTPDTLWNGLEAAPKAGEAFRQVLCNGLLRDWISWQNQPVQNETSPFTVLSLVIEKLAPHQDEWMKPGEPTRVFLHDVRDIPTLNLPYGNMPIIHASAGMKRILGLAYLLVWSWYEHVQASFLLNQAPTDRLILLIDEVEAHLHPKWQKSILPAILAVAEGIQAKIKTQLIATTHSPLVFASVEADLEAERDKLFLFELDGQTVTLSELNRAKQGRGFGWFAAEILGWQQQRSPEATTAIQAAYAWMHGNSMEEFPPHLRTKEQIHRELKRFLPEHDPFWPRWSIVKLGVNS